MEGFQKITEDIFCSKNIKEYLNDRTLTIFEGNLADKNYCSEEALVDCESPIEQMLSLEFEDLGLLKTSFFNPFVDVIAIEKQKEIICGDKRYFADFAIFVCYKNQGEKWFVVECDGHEFHQKTKEQVEKDNIRTRDLQKAGYEVIRFSGTEIWHKPFNCAWEVLKIILSKCKYITKEE